jgi:hypothetical protein
MNKKKHIFETFKKQIHELSKPCYIHGCEFNASFNHLLQKRGILNQIEENQHIYILIFNDHSDPPVYLDRKGINKNFGYRGFCGKHDNNLFKSIESDPVDHDIYQSQLLFSLRAFYNQRNKKEHLLTLYIASKSNEQTKDIIPEAFYKESTAALMDSLNEYETIENKLFDDLNYKSENFHFRTIHLPRTEVCLSSFFTYETTEELHELLRLELNYELTNIFMTFFPTENQSILILGVEKNKLKRCEEYLNQYSQNSDKVLKLISNVMLTSVEDWALSPRFYETNIKHREKQIIESIRKVKTNERQNLEINLFKM